MADAYPLFSHSDLTLISIGDAYANWASYVARYKIPERAKEELEAYYDERAAAAWDRVCTQYPLSPHVEDAKDRLIAMGQPVPEPTAAALAENQAEEDSRVNVKLGTKTLALLGHGPSTIHAARVGEPSLSTPTPVIPKDLNEQAKVAFVDAMNGKPIPRLTLPGQTAPAQNAATPAPAPGSEGGAVQTLQFGEVPTTNSAPGNSVSVQVTGEGESGGSGTGAPSGSTTPPTQRAGQHAAGGAGGTSEQQPGAASGRPTDAGSDADQRNSTGNCAADAGRLRRRRPTARRIRSRSTTRAGILEQAQEEEGAGEGQSVLGS